MSDPKKVDKGDAVQNAIASQVAQQQALEALSGKVQVKTMDLEGKGYVKKMLKVAAFKDAFTGGEEMTVKVINDAIEFLKEYIVSPDDEIIKLALLDDLSGMEIMSLFGAIMGQDVIPPANGGE